MKTTAAAQLSTETAQTTHNDDDALNEAGPSIKNTKESLRIIKDPEPKPLPQLPTVARNGYFSVMKKLFVVFKIRVQGKKDHLTKQQYENAIYSSHSLNSAKTQQRTAELERIERFRTSGM